MESKGIHEMDFDFIRNQMNKKGALQGDDPQN
jgi:hypothetical protein